VYNCVVLGWGVRSGKVGDISDTCVACGTPDSSVGDSGGTLGPGGGQLFPGQCPYTIGESNGQALSDLDLIVLKFKFQLKIPGILRKI
jgi:hypothetical protein